MKIARLFYLACLGYAISCQPTPESPPSIDRQAVVIRHNVKHADIDSLASLSVGNGYFTFTADITGLQSFPAFYEGGIPLGTQSDWGWIVRPNDEGYTLADVQKDYQVDGRVAPYVYRFNGEDRRAKASAWLRESPHRFHLGLIGLEMTKEDGSVVAIEDIENPAQELDLWTGRLRSRFEVEGSAVEVETYAHPEEDAVAVRIQSELARQGRLKVLLRFPKGIPGRLGYDLASAEDHETQWQAKTAGTGTFRRSQEGNIYWVDLSFGPGRLTERDRHEYELIPPAEATFTFSARFSKEPKQGAVPDFAGTAEKNAAAWPAFWQSGGFVDLGAVADDRARELERRIILSQYLTKIQCTGSLPPQETGLTYNSWNGKFHLEMHWWHAAHFTMWGRPEFLERQLGFYDRILDQARTTARTQGYAGARWPKMVGPDGRESPSAIGPFLIWQQPHLIYFAEQLYQFYERDPKILDRYRQLVFETADFMADYARWDSTGNRYVLGPALIPAQENFDPETTINPPFELTYWHWALSVAQQWRQRLEMEAEPKWQGVVDQISALPVRDGLYLFAENAVTSYEPEAEYMHDHPVFTGSLGMLPPTRMVDKQILERSISTIRELWDWESTWGWDYPMLAMAATELGRPDWAIEFLSMDVAKNTYLLSGHNYQRPDLTIYLPGNGGLLAAVAKMCLKGGFPADWQVKCEGLTILPGIDQ